MEMECEICGKETAKAKMVVVDGSTLVACPNCTGFGKEKPVPLGSRAPGSFSGERAKPVLRPVQSRVFFEPRLQEFDSGLEIVPDFGRRILQARQKKGLTAKELAMRIFEKESLLHRIENQSIRPSDEMISKLEKALGVQLKKEPDSEE